MDVLNYQPSFIARSLANHNTSTIAFIIDSANTETYGNDYFLRIQYGIEAALGKQGYYLLIISVANKKTGENNLKKLIMEGRVEGNHPSYGAGKKIHPQYAARGGTSVCRDWSQR
jgi:DNA-binding LacI/PurR family transcriptional regulator